MSIRDICNKSPAATLSVLVIIAGLSLLYFFKSRPSQTAVGSLAFYSIDDGATYFKDDANEIPPYDYQGHEAVRAIVLTCDGGQTNWVAYLQKYTDAAKEYAQENNLRGDLSSRPAMATQVLVKKPGDAAWVSSGSSKAIAVMTPVCPNGGKGQPIRVVP